MDDQPDLATPDAIEVPVDQAHRDRWVAKTAGLDRVISVAFAVEQPRTADWIANEAEVSTTTARAHLSRLVDLHVLTAVDQRGATTYALNTAYQRFRDVARLVEEHSRDELEALTVRTKAAIEELKTTHDVDSPTELRELATAAETAAAEARDLFTIASAWDGHRHRLAVAQQALERYDEFLEADAYRSLDSIA